MPTKPDAEEFSRILLWNICGLRADLRLMLQMSARSIEPDVRKADELYLSWIRETIAIQTKFYEDALDRVGIPPAKD